MNKSDPSVLFVCTGNAGRSQMAQALFRKLAGGEAEVESAGVAPWDRLHPMAVKVMGARGIGLDGHRPKSVSSVADRGFDCVVTIGGPARARLPKEPFSSAFWMHWDIADPADADGTPDSEAAFRKASAAIEARLPQVNELHTERLRARIGELAQAANLVPERLALEVALAAERGDVTEETVRLKSHLDHAEELIRGQEPAGRKLNFLLQEMQREANTLGAKVRDTEVVRHVLEIKSELERIREQIQNIE